MGVILTGVATHINGIIGVCGGGMGVRTFSTNSISIHCQDNAVFDFLGLDCVPFPITEISGGSGLICGCYPTSTIVDVK